MPVRYEIKDCAKKDDLHDHRIWCYLACNFPRTGESVLMAGQRLRCWPTLKSTILKQGPLFQLSDILYTGTEIKHDIICRYHSYHTK